MQDLTSPGGDLEPIERASADELTPESAAAAAGDALTARVKNTIGVTVTTSVLAPESIERSVGKMRRVVDHRPR